MEHLGYRRLFLMIVIASSAMLVADTTSDKEQKELDDLLSLSMVELMSIEITTANKVSTNLSESGAFTTILLAEDIRRNGWQTLTEAIAAQVGFFSYSDRIYDFIVPRGFALPNDPNSRLLILINGHSMIEPFGYYNGHLASVDLSQVERIEIVRGPSSALYGTNAVFAVINLITFNGKNAEGFRVESRLGSWDDQRLVLTHGKELNSETDLIFGASYRHGGDQVLYFDEYDDPAYPSDGYSRGEANIEDVFNGYLKLHRGDWTFHAMYNNRKKRVPTGLYGGSFNDDGTFFQDINGFMEVKYSHQFGNRSAIRSRVYVDDYQFKGRFQYDADEDWVTGPPYEAESNRIENTTFGGEILLERSWNDRHQSLAGMEYKLIDSLLFEYQSVNDPLQLVDEYHDLDLNESILALFLQHRIRPNEKFLIEFGIHYDEYEETGSHTNLRGSAGYRFGESSWLKLNYGEAYRAPNLWERRVGGFFLEANPELEPETIQTAELVLVHSLNTNTSWTSTLSRYQLEDIIQAGTGMFENVSSIKGYGAETEVKYISSKFRGFANAAYFSVESDQTQERIAYSPDWQLKFGMTMRPHEKRFEWGFNSIWTGERLNGDSSQPKSKSYLLVNLRLATLKLTPHFDLSIRVTNLLDEDYEHPSFIGDLATWNRNAQFPVYDIPGDPRAFYLSVHLKL